MSPSHLFCGTNSAAINARRIFLLFWLFALSSLLAPDSRAQNGSQFKNWRPALNEGVAVKPKEECSALVSLTGYEFSIETATLVPASGDIPEFCHVTGQILPEVRFEVSMPPSWNKRFYMFGNGGYAGENLESPLRAGARNAALKAGFAVAQTNTGHDAAIEPLGSFAVDRQKMLDYAWRAVHVTAETSKQIVQRYYGTKQARSYFDGCSTGGRQGLMSAQRFPDDFDGILVGAPVLDFTGTTMIGAWNARALEAAPIPLEKLKIIADRVYSKCDAIDGLKDGLIDDPRLCQFDPATELPLCPNDADAGDCFTTGQIHSLEAIYRGAESGGKQIFWGQPLGAEIDMLGPGGRSQSGWTAWIISPSGRSIAANFAETFYRYLAFQKPNFDLKSFDFARDPQRLQTIGSIIDAKNPDLSRFKAHSSKIIMYFGWADPALNPLMAIDYYEKVKSRMGESTPDFFRLFMVPGMAHCRGGVGTDEFDAFTALVEWVEKGITPRQIVASQTKAGKLIRTRPLCPYPQAAKYKGTGSPDEAANFECKAP
jgi:hypothetical protein